jgi:hypothetical protein
LEPLQKFYQPMKGVSSTTSASELAIEAKRLRLLAKEAYKGNPDLGHALSNVRNSMFDDAVNSGVPELRAIATTQRREAAVGELQEIMRQANPLKAYKDLQKKNALFRNVFDKPGEQDQIKNILKKMSTVTPSGFSGVAGRGLAGIFGNQVAGIPGAVAAFIAPEMAAGAISTKIGRNFMEKLLVGGTWDAPKAAALAQFWRAQMAQDATSGNIAEQVRAALKNSDVSVDDKIAAAAYQQGIKEAAKTEPSQSWGLGIEIDKMLRKIQEDIEPKKE